jgi:hypothetical protein
LPRSHNKCRRSKDCTAAQAATMLRQPQRIEIVAVALVLAMASELATATAAEAVPTTERKHKVSRTVAVE